MDNLATWSPYHGSTSCPKCGQTGSLEVCQVLQARKIGTFSLAGAQMKVPARVVWQYRCTACGAQGEAEPKESPEEQARILREARGNITE